MASTGAVTYIESADTLTTESQFDIEAKEADIEFKVTLMDLKFYTMIEPAITFNALYESNQYSQISP